MTEKSRAEPGVAGALRLLEPSSLSGLGVWEQALTANTTANAAAMRDDPASHLDSCILKFPSPDLGASVGHPVRERDISPRLQAS